MRKIHFLTCIAAFSLLSSCDNNKSGNNAEMTTEDGVLAEEGRNMDERLDGADIDTQNDGIDFVKEAAVGGMLEVELGKLAQQKASSKSVKDFGQRMVTDHGKANSKLKTLATEKSIDIPATLPAKEQEEIDQLAELSGQEFDQQYINMMVEDHHKDIDAFENASKEVQDTAIRNFASSTLPVLKEHLQIVNDINQQLQNM